MPPSAATVARLEGSSAPREVGWAGPSPRARLLTALLSIVLASLTFVIVSFAWKRAAPLPPRATPVEVNVIATPARATATAPPPVRPDRRALPSP